MKWGFPEWRMHSESWKDFYNNIHNGVMNLNVDV